MSQYSYWADEILLLTLYSIILEYFRRLHTNPCAHTDRTSGRIYVLFNIVKQKCKKSKVKCNRDSPCSLFNTEEPNLLSYCPTFETYAI